MANAAGRTNFSTPASVAPTSSHVYGRTYRRKRRTGEKRFSGALSGTSTSGQQLRRNQKREENFGNYLRTATTASRVRATALQGAVGAKRRGGLNYNRHAACCTGPSIVTGASGRRKRSMVGLSSGLMRSSL